MYREISLSLKELTEGKVHRLNEILKEVKPKTVLLGPSKTSVSIEEAVILLNRFNFLVDKDLDPVYVKALDLLSSWGIVTLFL